MTQNTLTKTLVLGFAFLAFSPLTSADDGRWERRSAKHHYGVKKAMMELVTKEEIREAIGVYAQAWDAKDIDGVLTIFTDDASWEHFVHGFEQPVFVAQSIEEIAGMAFFTFEFNTKGISTRHMQSNTLFNELSYDQASTVTTIVITHQTEGDTVPRLVFQGRYLDDWRKTEGVWKISRRRFMNDARPPQNP